MADKEKRQILPFHALRTVFPEHKLNKHLLTQEALVIIVPSLGIMFCFYQREHLYHYDWPCMPLVSSI